MLKNVKIFYEIKVEIKKRAFHRAVLLFIKKYNNKIKSLSVFFIDDDTIRTINKTYLSHDSATDVITLNYSRDDYYIDAEIYISVDTAKSNSIRYKTNLNEELLRYLVHGLLHIAGYNDKTKFEKRKMKSEEDKLVSEFYNLIFNQI